MDEQLLDLAYRKLFETLQKGGIDRICQIASELLNKPVLIVNEELRKLAQYPETFLNDAVWDSFLQDGIITSQMIWQLRNDALMEQSEKSDLPSWVDWGLFRDFPRLVCNVRIGGVIRGYVGVLCKERNSTDLDIRITQLVAQAVGIELKQQPSLNIRYPAIITAFISDLFQGMIKNEAELSSWEKSMGKRLKPPFYVAAIGGDNRVSTTLYYLRASLITSGGNVFVTVSEGILYVLFSEVNTRQTYAEFFKGQENNIAESLKTHRLSVGMSSLFDDILQVVNYKDQAKRSLELGKIYHPDGYIYFYPELVLENILSFIWQNVSPENYLHPAIAILEKHDRENQTDYLKTLGGYVMSMCNSNRTIGKLHIHRNTLLYRLNKIQELTGLDLDDMKQCALLLNNFYIMAYRR